MIYQQNNLKKARNLPGNTWVVP